MRSFELSRILPAAPVRWIRDESGPLRGDDPRRTGEADAPAVQVGGEGVANPGGGRVTQLVGRVRQRAGRRPLAKGEGQPMIQLVHELGRLDVPELKLIKEQSSKTKA